METRANQLRSHTFPIRDRVEDGVILFDRDLRCLAWNSLIEKLSQVPVEDMAGKHCWEESSFLREMGIHDQVITALQGKPLACPDTLYRTNSGEAIWLAPACSPLRNEEGQICGVIVTLRNITENKRVKEALLSREVEPGEVRSDAKKGNWEWDIKTDITTWSEQLYRIAGRDPKTAVPSFKEHSSFYTSDSWERLTTATLRVLQGGVPYELELQMLRSDGTRRWVMGSGEAVRETGGHILRLRGTIEDITERKWQVIRGEREVESIRNADYRISGRLIKAQEEENARIAKELRDNICQRLSLLAVGIQRLSTPFPESTLQVHRSSLDELWRHTAELVAEIGQVSRQLHPSTLDLLGLPLAIRGLCREFASRTSIPVECSCTDVRPEKLQKDVVLSFFRILEEALGNVAKHSHARNVSVELIGSSEELLLRVSDNGVGLEPEKTRIATGLGLIRMKERLRSIVGELVVWSTRTCGTRIEARAPLRESLPV
jgi:PAS domain S-box-containing protein